MAPHILEFKDGRLEEIEADTLTPELGQNGEPQRYILHYKGKEVRRVEAQELKRPPYLKRNPPTFKQSFEKYQAVYKSS